MAGGQRGGRPAARRGTDPEASGCTDACLKRLAATAPAGLLEFSGGKLSYTGGSDPAKAIALLGSQKLCEHGSLQVRLEEGTQYLQFETDGALSAREAFRFALKDLKRRFEELREAVQAIP